MQYLIRENSCTLSRLVRPVRTQFMTEIPRYWDCILWETRSCHPVRTAQYYDIVHSREISFARIFSMVHNTRSNACFRMQSNIQHSVLWNGCYPRCMCMQHSKGCASSNFAICIVALEELDGQWENFDHLSPGPSCSSGPRSKAQYQSCRKGQKHWGNLQF